MKFSYLGPQAISVDDFWCLIIAMWVRNQSLGTPPTEVGILGKNPVYQYISNVLVQSGPARRLAWRQHITVTVRFYSLEAFDVVFSSSFTTVDVH